MRFIRYCFAGITIFLFSQTAFAQPYRLNFCNMPEFYCTQVQKGQTWDKLFPDSTQRDVVMRLNRMNIPLSRGMIIAVPKDLQNTSAMDIAPFDQQIPASGNKSLIVDPAQLAWGAYDADGRLIKWGPMSGGKNWCPDIGQSCRTVTGNFAVYSKRGEGCESSKFPIPTGGAPMPYCMFFKGGFALHASPQVPGYHASHGCVRTFYEDARWLNEEFIEIGTPVIVHPYSRTT